MVKPPTRTPPPAPGLSRLGLKELYFHHANGLNAHLGRLGHDDEEAYALTQEFFVQLLQRREAFPSARLFRADAGARVWLWTRLRELLPACLEALQDPHVRRQSLPPKGPVLEQGGTVTSSLVAVYWQEQARRMDPGRLRAFVLVVFDDFSLEQAAAIEGVTLETMTARYAAAREELEPVFRAMRQRVTWQVNESGQA